MDPKQLMVTIAKVCGTTLEKVFSKTRRQDVVTARQLIHYFLREKTDMSLFRIGAMTRRDHSSVLYSAKMINNYIEIGDPEILKLITKINSYEKSISTGRSYAFDHKKIRARMHIPAYVKQNLLRQVGVNGVSHAAKIKGPRLTTVLLCQR